MPDDIDSLSIVPPEAFVAARDALAKDLKAQGDTARAAEVKKLRRPSVAEWLASQVRHHHADVIDALRRASQDVAAAQESAIVDHDRDALQRATASRREAMRAVERAVDDVLARTGRPVHYRDEVAQTIQMDVTAEVTSGTFGLRDDLELPEPAKPKPRARDVAAERRAAEARSAIEAAEKRVQRARVALDEAVTELEATQARFGDGSP